jgi:CHAD domain-containing protein
MTARPPELVVDRDVVDQLAVALDTVGMALGDAAAPPTELRRTWLDTFDWRLHRAGWELEEVELDGTNTFALHGSGDHHDRHDLGAVPGDRVEWPAPPAALPDSAVRAQVAAAAGIRALIRTAGFEGVRRTWPVLDDEQKTVARLHVDVPAGASALPARITVSPVRGYERDAAQAAHALVTLDGVTAAPTSCYDECLEASGQKRGGARSVATVSAWTPAAVAVAGVLRGFLGTVEANVPGVVADIDTEFLHDLRVAVRRARSTVKLAGNALPVPLGHFAAELKWLGDATTPTRDLDVYLLGVPAMAERLRAARPAELGAFREHLAARRAEVFGRLVTDLGSARFTALVRCWREVTVVDPDTVPPVPTTAEYGAEALRRAHRRVVRLGSTITSSSPAEQLHTLRKRCKELRYLLEIFEPIEPPATRKRVLPALRALQDCLGEFQDGEVQAAAVRTFATEMMAAGTAGPATLLAMGELAAQLDGDQHHARAIFANVFAAFAKATRKLHWGDGDR